jgi:hypothetical protein
VTAWIGSNNVHIVRGDDSMPPTVPAPRPPNQSSAHLPASPLIITVSLDFGVGSKV